MNKLELLRQKVFWLYASQHPDRDAWATWLWEQHVPVVARKAHEVAIDVGANAELAEASAWLHDIADTIMPRFVDGRETENHSAESRRLARQIMLECGYPPDAIATVVDDALPLHGCRDGKHPRSLEGKVLATADALAHLTTDYYDIASRKISYRLKRKEIKDWVLKKADRDLNDKICFDEIREEVRADYERIHEIFSR